MADLPSGGGLPPRGLPSRPGSVPSSPPTPPISFAQEVPPVFDEPSVPAEAPAPPKLPDFEKSSPTVVNNHGQKLIGLDKCGRCGSTDLDYSIEKAALICQSCRFEDHGINVADRFGSAADISKLAGRVISSGAQEILTDDVQVSISCQGCGAEVVVNTDESLTARCHWCRQRLSIDNQIPNGAVPDGIVTFKVTKEQAIEKVREFVKSRRSFANKKFLAEFKPENVFGVYLPYVIADAKFTGGASGRAEKHLRSYTRGTEKNKTTYYDFEEYDVERELAVLADDISLEASSKRQIEVASNTNNVIDAVFPFPIETAVDFRAHYLTNFNSERRDLDTGDLDGKLMDKMLTVLRAKADETVKPYEKRGVRWEREWAKLLGAHQASIYLPIWLYSFVEENAKNPRTKERGPLIHYIAVNGVTGNTMGSVPINWGKLHAVSWAIGLAVGGPTAYGYMLLNGFPLVW